MKYPTNNPYTGEMALTEESIYRNGAKLNGTLESVKVWLTAIDDIEELINTTINERGNLLGI